MCGLTGFFSPQGFADVEARAILTTMRDTLIHRGPDDAGGWLDSDAGIALAHRRLAILDLSSAGHQPMASSSGRFVIAFNGEIYNHHDLRAELDRTEDRPSWKGLSDTETVLAGIERWGLVATLRKSVGMFAIALWDRERRTLILARDRMGEKPLYYGVQSGVLLFGSELKALKAHPAFRAEIDRGALSLLMRHSYIPAPYSIFKHIKKLLPGTVLTFRCPADEAAPAPYWSLGSCGEIGQPLGFGGTAIEAADQLEGLLKEAVGQQMIADVPLGAFLSGGVDSSLVAALMQAQSPRPVRTFSIGFEEDSYNEAHHALAVSRHLGTEHTELYVTSRQARDLVPAMPRIYSEPFADNSQIPTYLVCSMARQHVTVSLSGDGGDELFCGYDRYASLRKWGARLERVPKVLHTPLARLASIGGRLDLARRESWERLADLLVAPSNGHIYRQLISHWRHPIDLVIGGWEPPTAFSELKSRQVDSNLIDMAMAIDQMTYLPDEILCKVDRAGMAVSLETRMPLLNHRVVEFAGQLPLAYKLRGHVNKWILRQVLERYLPRQYFERPKMGFGVPIGAWLRGDLKEWAAELLNASRLRQQGYLEPSAILNKWNEHQAGVRNWDSQLWVVLMFEAWREAF